MMKVPDFLVSVVVITYNSSKFITETLESIKVQTYKNLELIISDDASKDDTVEICRRWIEENKERFVETRLLTVEQNTGIAANCNRGYQVAKGLWIKGIAGDDALLPDCVEHYVDFVNGKSEREICHSRAKGYLEYLDERHFLKSIAFGGKILSSKSAWEQYKLLYRGAAIVAPSVFIKNDLIKRMGYFNEALPLCEDWPLWLKITRSGTKFFFLDRETVKYRLHSVSVSRSKSDYFILSRINEVHEYVYDHYLTGDHLLILRWRMKYTIMLYHFLEKYELNKRTRLHTLIFHLFNFPLFLSKYCDYVYLNGWRYCFNRLKDSLFHY